MFTRVLLLLSIAWIMRLTAPLFEVLGQEISGRDLILLIGGLFLIYQSTMEIHEKLEGEEGEKDKSVASSFAGVIDRKSVVAGKSVSVSVGLGGRVIIKKKN